MLKVFWHAFSKQENILQLYENVLNNGFLITLCEKKQMMC